MDLPESEDSSFDDFFSSLLSSQQEIEHAEWSSEENKLFEKAMAELDPLSPAFFENIASRVPWRSIEEIKKHYQEQVEDIQMIETGCNLTPNYETCDQQQEKEKEKEEPITDQPKNKTGRPRQKGVPWTEEEHQLFLIGLNKYGKGHWRSISRNYVTTKTPTQVASHAQKYFRRHNTSTPPNKRRPSIHDIRTVNFPWNEQLMLPSFPNPNYGLINPMFNNMSYNYGRFAQSGDFSYNDQRSMIVPSMEDSTFPAVVTNPMINQPSDASYSMMNYQPFDASYPVMNQPLDASYPMMNHPSDANLASCLEPSLWNNQWG